ncbi:DUF5701 family protein [Serinibacter salmoneus]|uniref:Uncharacterized protein n=1 Tax=Serinibacter salmoneus TaxID=556530 RepID=A0A2A9D2H1_9MICO|nr:DUF5701 family protein [Serinibacter salmoneus]PFG20918.1 hypothetical protein ATL40_2534 [Serinibacter salmoneus]
MTASAHPEPLPDLASQLQRYFELGIPALAGVTEGDLGDAAADLQSQAAPSGTPLLALHPDLIPARALAPLLAREGRPGFVVEDWSDLEDFTTVPTVELPPAPLYLVHGIDRGDHLRGASPEEALTALAGDERSPLTLHEGISWLLQEPGRLEPNHCFMTIATRRPKPRGGYDSRTPALWISGGTGRDGAARRGAPKVGWCWWRNRHTWLGFASAAGRAGK